MTSIVIQHIYCRWTKASRGGEGARQRNSIPLAVRLPLSNLDFPFILHAALFAEDHNFVQRDSFKTAATFYRLDVRDLGINVDTECATIRFYRDPYNAARSSRYPFQDVFTLKQRDWVQIQFNGRYADGHDSNWWYRYSTYNIGYFDEYDEDVFIATKPSHNFSEMAKLR